MTRAPELQRPASNLKASQHPGVAISAQRQPPFALLRVLAPKNVKFFTLTDQQRLRWTRAIYDTAARERCETSVMTVF